MSRLSSHFRYKSCWRKTGPRQNRLGAERAGGVRREPRLALGISPLALAGCSDAPSQTIFGSYFPSWMLCALAGLAGSIVLHLGLVAVGIDIDKVLPSPLIVDLAVAVFFAFAIWLAWLG